MLNRSSFGCAALSQRSWKISQWESLKILHVTTSSSTNIPMRATTWSPQVNDFPRVITNSRKKQTNTVFCAGFCVVLLLMVLHVIPISLSFPSFFVVFIYSMPGYKCSIKERMLYSSCKNPLVDMVENNLQIEIEKKVRHCVLWYTRAVL